MKTASRRAQPTPENLEEARRLKEIWDREKSRRPLAQAAFGEQFDIGNQSAVSQFLKGDTPLSLKAARGFATGLGCEIGDFSPRLAMEAAKNAAFVSSDDDDDFVDVERVDVQLGAGPGKEATVHESIGSLKFRRDFLRSCGIKGKDGKIVNVKGNSMYPNIPDGAVLLINMRDTDLVSGEIYALSHHDEGLIVKQAVRTEKGWVARSFNPDNKDIPIDDGHPARAIGRAVWMGAKL